MFEFLSKPRITRMPIRYGFFTRMGWQCRDFRTSGHGDSPKAAYDDWQQRLASMQRYQWMPTSPKFRGFYG